MQTISLTNGALLAYNAALQSLAGRKLPTRFSYAVARSASQVEAALGVLESERTRIAGEHAKLDDDGNPVVEGSQYVLDDRPGFAKAYGELLEIETEVSVYQVSVDDFLKVDVEVEPGVVAALIDRLIVEDVPA